MGMPPRPALFLTALACACSPALLAVEGNPPDCRYGIQITGAVPLQDLKAADGRTGLGGGVFVESSLDSRTILQTRLDFIKYPQTNQPNAAAVSTYTLPGPSTLSLNAIDIGADLRHYLPLIGGDKLFLLAGLMGVRYEFQSSAPSLLTSGGVPVGGVTRFKDKTDFTLGWAVGFGFDFDRSWALSGRYTSMTIRGAVLATFESSLSYRF